MAGVNNQAIHDNYTSSSPPDQEHHMNHNYTYSYSHPWHGTNPAYANSLLPLNQTDNRGSIGISLQPPNQNFPLSSPGPYNYNNIPTSENMPFYNPLYRYVENNEHQVNNRVPLTNYNSGNTIHPSFICQTLPPTPTYSSNTDNMAPNATSQSCVIIIMNANVNLEKLLSVIQ